MNLFQKQKSKKSIFVSSDKISAKFGDFHSSSRSSGMQVNTFENNF